MAQGKYKQKQQEKSKEKQSNHILYYLGNQTGFKQVKQKNIKNVVKEISSQQNKQEIQGQRNVEEQKFEQIEFEIVKNFEEIDQDQLSEKLQSQEKESYEESDEIQQEQDQEESQYNDTQDDDIESLASQKNPYKIQCYICLGKHHRKDCGQKFQQCMKCGSSDHIVKLCRVNPKNVCANCQKIGHKSTECQHLLTNFVSLKNLKKLFKEEIQKLDVIQNIKDFELLLNDQVFGVKITKIKLKDTVHLKREKQIKHIQNENKYQRRNFQEKELNEKHKQNHKEQKYQEIQYQQQIEIIDNQQKLKNTNPQQLQQKNQQHSKLYIPNKKRERTNSKQKAQEKKSNNIQQNVQQMNKKIFIKKEDQKQLEKLKDDFDQYKYQYLYKQFYSQSNLQ